jgi:hypothetical protein
MSTESPAPQDAAGGSPPEREALYAQTEFLWKALKETANLLMKAITFFLAVTAAILSYVLSHPVAQPVRNTAFRTVIAVTLTFAVAVGSVSWGLWTGVRDLQRAQEMLSPDSFAKLRLRRFFARARVVFWIIVTTTLLILLILIAAISRSLLE